MKGYYMVDKNRKRSEMLILCSVPKMFNSAFVQSVSKYVLHKHWERVWSLVHEDKFMGTEVDRIVSFSRVTKGQKTGMEKLSKTQVYLENCQKYKQKRKRRERE